MNGIMQKHKDGGKADSQRRKISTKRCDGSFFTIHIRAIASRVSLWLLEFCNILEDCRDMSERQALVCREKRGPRHFVDTFFCWGYVLLFLPPVLSVRRRYYQSRRGKPCPNHLMPRNNRLFGIREPHDFNSFLAEYGMGYLGNQPKGERDKKEWENHINRASVRS
jgi:hypothetical protein